MYSNNIVNFQESTTILNVHTKKSGNLLYALYIYIYIYTHTRRVHVLHCNIFSSKYGFNLQSCPQSHKQKQPWWYWFQASVLKCLTNRAWVGIQLNWKLLCSPKASLVNCPHKNLTMIYNFCCYSNIWTKIQSFNIWDRNLSFTIFDCKTPLNPYILLSK